jgi:hypothetical protein
VSTITVQMGHVPRRTGATGTHREQEFTRSVGSRLAEQLRKLGHRVHLIGADDPVPAADVFVALHCDGSSNPARRGASVGYPDAAGARLAAAWKRAHQRHGYPGGFLRDNYTPALASYYGFGRARALPGGQRIRFLAEHGTTTNKSDEAWLFANLKRCVQAHVDAIGEVVGHPKPPTPVTPLPVPEGPMYQLLETVDTKRLYAYAPGEIRHIPSPDAFFDMVALESFPSQTAPDGKVSSNDVFQVQVDRTAAMLRDVRNEAVR